MPNARRRLDTQLDQSVRGSYSLCMVVDQAEVSESPEIERLKFISHLIEVFHGLGIAFGLSLLWIMEIVRDRVFRILDRANARPRTRPASAFPPGQPHRRPPRQAY
jgi:hypothetical protein